MTMTNNQRTVYTTVWVSGANVGSSFASSPKDAAPDAPKTPISYYDLTNDEIKEAVLALDMMARFYSQFVKETEAPDGRSP